MSLRIRLTWVRVSVSRTIFDSPAGISIVTGRSVTDAARLRLRGLWRSVTVPVAVIEQTVSQPTRTATERVVNSPLARIGRTLTCGPSGSGSVGSLGGG